MKLFLDLAPLIAFFIGFKAGGIALATGLLILITLATLAIGYWRERRLAWSPLITAVVVVFFGALTLAYDNEVFIKMKPTMVNLVFAAVLMVGLVRYKTGLLKHLFGSAFKLTEEGWRTLSWRWAWFFVFLAALNEVVWRHVTTDVWVNFKVFGLLGIFFVFNVIQIMLMGKYVIPEATTEKES